MRHVPPFLNLLRPGCGLAAHDHLAVLGQVAIAWNDWASAAGEPALIPGVHPSLVCHIDRADALALVGVIREQLRDFRFDGLLAVGSQIVNVWKSRRMVQQVMQPNPAQPVRQFGKPRD